MTEKINILWVDDEIELLKPHILFLEKKNYAVDTANNGTDALDQIANNLYDIIFLDEQMPGLSGIETLERIKKDYPFIPIVMITKSEEEQIMEEAIGSQIADYLIKPVNPNQILLSLKRNLDNKRLVSEKTTQQYQQSFGKISMEISMNPNFREIADIYKRLVRWELNLQKTNDSSMNEVIEMQKSEANTVFAKIIENNYENWLHNRTEDKPTFSHTLLKEKVFPLLRKDKPVFLLVIDNLRYDQWKFIQPLIQEKFNVEKDEVFHSILPTTTQYSRNAMFAGLMPLDIQKKYPQWWKSETDEGSKNNFERELLRENLKRHAYDSKFSYHKVLNLEFGKKVVNSLPNLMRNPLNVIVYNFIDMLSHARTEMDIIKELADDEKAYRSLTLSWFEHSQLMEIFDYLATKDVEVIITTDHGSVKVDNPIKVVGDRDTNTNLRYKTGKTISYTTKEVYAVENPNDIFLPKENVNSKFIFSRKNDFFVYPNNMNYYTKYYKDTFQHGGITMEEVLIPFIHLSPKG